MDTMKDKDPVSGDPPADRFGRTWRTHVGTDLATDRWSRPVAPRGGDEQPIHTGIRRSDRVRARSGCREEGSRL